MGRTAMPLRQFVVLIVLAVLLAVAGGVAVNMGLPDDAGAQSEPLTWHVFALRQWGQSPTITGDPYIPSVFVEQRPGECLLVPSPHDEAIYFYSCPFEWEPVRR